MKYIAAIILNKLIKNKELVYLLYLHLFLLWCSWFLYVDLEFLSYIIFLLSRELLLTFLAWQVCCNKFSQFFSQKVLISPLLLTNDFTEHSRLEGCFHNTFSTSFHSSCLHEFLRSQMEFLSFLLSVGVFFLWLLSGFSFIFWFL